jgi:hypothetical protein
MASEVHQNPIVYGIVGFFSTVFVYIQTNADIMENVLDFALKCVYGFMGGVLWHFGKTYGEKLDTFLKKRAKQKCK